MFVKARFLIKYPDILLAISPVFSIFLYLCCISKPLKIRGQTYMSYQASKFELIQAQIKLARQLFFWAELKLCVKAYEYYSYSNRFTCFIIRFSKLLARGLLITSSITEVKPLELNQLLVG